jgi:N-acetyl-gamma-glutamyl-phosphate reductase
VCAPHYFVSAVTGSTGSGREPKEGTHHPERHGNFRAYGALVHRHRAEMEMLVGAGARVAFVPHSGPFARGIHLTAALPLRRAVALAEVQAIFGAAYAHEPFVEVLQHGAPDIRRVAGSNRVALGVHVRDDVLTVLVTLDNLVKGGGGQALQCLNLMLDYPETWGLPRSGLGVC